MALIRDLERKHPSYDPGCLRDLDLFYQGGQALIGSLDGDRKDTADALLRMLFDIPTGDERFFRRTKESGAEFSDRKRRAYALGYMGTVVDFFAASAMGDPPRLSIEGGDKTFWEEFADDCDRAGTDIGEFSRQRLVEALVFRRAYAYVDTPPPAEKMPESLAEQDAIGERRAYLTPICTHELIDWEKDDEGGFSFFVIRQEHCPRVSVSQDRDTRMIMWRVWERGRLYLYEKSLKKGEVLKDDESVSPMPAPVRAADGLDGIPSPVCPLVELAVPCGLHVGGKLLSAERENFNKQNALAWAEYRCAFSFLKIKVKDWDEFLRRTGLKATDGSVMPMMPDEDALWESHPPAALADLRATLDRLKEEIFRVASQLSLAAPLGAVAQAASGEAKRRDSAPAAIVCSSLGRMVREWLLKIIDVVAGLRGETVTAEVAGLSDYEDVVELLLRVLPELASPTAEAAARKRIVAKVLPELTPEQRAAIDEEIEAEIKRRKEEAEAMEQAQRAAVEAAGAKPMNGPGAPAPKAFGRK